MDVNKPYISKIVTATIPTSMMPLGKLVTALGDIGMHATCKLQGHKSSEHGADTACRTTLRNGSIALSID